MGLTQILPLRWLRPAKKAQFCLRCGAEFEEPKHTLCAKCRDMLAAHG